MITDFQLITEFKPFYKAGKDICLTSDGYIIADDGENINYVNCETLQLITTLNKKSEVITCFVANPKDLVVIMANKEGQIVTLDRSNPKRRLKTWNNLHSAPIFAMSLDSTSSRLATGGADSKVRIWHLGEKEGKTFSCTYHKSKINILKYHPKRPMVVSISMLDHVVAAWNTDNGKLLGLFSGHQNAITAVDFHGDSDAMVTASRDRTIIIWDCETFAMRSMIPSCESVETCIVWQNSANSDDDIRLMIGGERGIMAVVSVTKRTVVQEFSKKSLFTNEVDSQCNLRAIRTIIANDDGVVVVRESDNMEWYSNTMTLRYELAGEISSIRDVVMMGEQGEMMLAVESAPYMRLFDCNPLLSGSNNCTQWPSQLIAGGHSAEIMSVSVFDSGRMLASGGKDGVVCIWRLDKKDEREKLKLVTSLSCENSIVSSLCVDRSGTRIYVNYILSELLAVLSFDGKCLVRLCEIYKPHGGIVSTMDVNIDCSLCATGSKDKLAKIWFYDNKKKTLLNRGTLKGHKRGIWSVQFSLIERVLLTASMDTNIRLWSLENLDCILQLESDCVMYKAMFSPCEKQIISCDEDGFVKIWDREKRVESYSVKVSDRAVHAMNLVYDKKGRFSGFVAAGDQSMMCLYKDNTKEQILESKKVKEFRLQNEQELDNLLAQEQFSSALKLAVRLNKILVAYKILDRINRSEKVSETVLSPIEYCQTALLARACSSLTADELRTLLQFAIKWITNERTVLIATRVFMFLFCTVSNEELCQNEDLMKHLEAIKFHNRKYHAQVLKYKEYCGLLRYMAEITKVKAVEEQSMDTD